MCFVNAKTNGVVFRLIPKLSRLLLLSLVLLLLLLLFAAVVNHKVVVVVVVSVITMLHPQIPLLASLFVVLRDAPSPFRFRSLPRVGCVG